MVLSESESSSLRTEHEADGIVATGLAAMCVALLCGVLTVSSCFVAVEARRRQRSYIAPQSTISDIVTERRNGVNPTDPQPSVGTSRVSTRRVLRHHCSYGFVIAGALVALVSNSAISFAVGAITTHGVLHMIQQRCAIARETTFLVVFAWYTLGMSYIGVVSFSTVSLHGVWTTLCSVASLAIADAIGGIWCAIETLTARPPHNDGEPVAVARSTRLSHSDAVSLAVLFADRRDPEDLVPTTATDATKQQHRSTAVRIELAHESGKRTAETENETKTDDGTCTVCLDSLIVGSCCVLHCGHKVHKECLVAWWQRSATCPICRSSTLSH